MHISYDVMRLIALFLGLEKELIYLQVPFDHDMLPKWLNVSKSCDIDPMYKKYGAYWRRIEDNFGGYDVTDIDELEDICKMIKSAVLSKPIFRHIPLTTIDVDAPFDEAYYNVTCKKFACTYVAPCGCKLSNKCDYFAVRIQDDKIVLNFNNIIDHFEDDRVLRVSHLHNNLLLSIDAWKFRCNLHGGVNPTRICFGSNGIRVVV